LSSGSDATKPRRVAHCPTRTARDAGARKLGGAGAPALRPPAQAWTAPQRGRRIHVPKGCVYTAIAFSVAIEMLNELAQRNRRKFVATIPARRRTAHAILRLVGGMPAAEGFRRDRVRARRARRQRRVRPDRAADGGRGARARAPSGHPRS
jgi:hypothetical protein